MSKFFLCLWVLNDKYSVTRPVSPVLSGNDPRYLIPPQPSVLNPHPSVSSYLPSSLTKVVSLVGDLSGSFLTYRITLLTSLWCYLFHVPRYPHHSTRPRSTTSWNSSTLGKRSKEISILATSRHEGLTRYLRSPQVDPRSLPEPLISTLPLPRP